MFQPYDQEDIESIIDEKVNKHFPTFVAEIKDTPQFIDMKKFFFALRQEDAMKYLGAQISKKSGDIRVVFDVMKSALSKLLNQVK